MRFAWTDSCDWLKMARNSPFLTQTECLVD